MTPNRTGSDQSEHSGKKRPTAAMMAKLAGHIWTFNELFETVLVLQR
jgi:hypothetical protein